MRKFRVRLTAAVVIERFVTVEVEDGPNAAMLALGLADQKAKTPGEFWAVRGSTLDRVGEPEQVRMADLSALNSSVSVSDATEEVEGYEVFKISAKGYQRLEFFPSGPTEDTDSEAATAADRERLLQLVGPNEHVGVRDVF